MLSVLTKKQCADCGLCCSFDSYDLWDTPLVTDEILLRALELDPAQRFSEASGRRLLVMEKEPDRDLYYCPLLDRETGCRLGDDKPFDCRIFPLKIMVLGGRLVITVSPVCPEAVKLPLEELIAEAKRLSARIFAEAQREPDIVRPYEKGYPILVVGDEIQHIQGE